MATSLAANAQLAITGHDVWNYGNESCMRSTWLGGGVKNQCSSTELWVVPVPGAIYSSNYYNYNVTVIGTKNSTATQCIAIATDVYGNNVGQSSWGNMGTGSGWTQITLPVTVPSYANLQVQCSIAPQGIVQYIHI